MALFTVSWRTLGPDRTLSCTASGFLATKNRMLRALCGHQAAPNFAEMSMEHLCLSFTAVMQRAEKDDEGRAVVR